MLVLETKQVCHLATRCPYAGDCWGAKSGRETQFTCTLVDENGKIQENAFRNPHDQTGKMKVIHG